MCRTPEFYILRSTDKNMEFGEVTDEIDDRHHSPEIACEVMSTANQATDE